MRCKSCNSPARMNRRKMIKTKNQTERLYYCTKCGETFRTIELLADIPRNDCRTCYFNGERCNNMNDVSVDKQGNCSGHTAMWEVEKDANNE